MSETNQAPATYKFKEAATHTDLLSYLNTRPFSEVGELIPLIKGEADQEFKTDDIVKVVTYIINRPYFEVFKIANKLVNIDESSVKPDVAPDSVAAQEPQA